MKLANTTFEEKKFIPDTRKIVHRHIRNIDDVITDEDLKSIRISQELPSFFIRAGKKAS